MCRPEQHSELFDSSSHGLLHVVDLEDNSLVVLCVLGKNSGSFVANAYHSNDHVPLSDDHISDVLRDCVLILLTSQAILNKLLEDLDNLLKAHGFGIVYDALLM